MAKTINRNPYSVATPEVDYNFFNHTEWKGKVSNKNFLAVDQQTFEDCKNVYISSEGLLKSRPSIKFDDFDELSEYKILDSWIFDTVRVHLVEDKNNKWHICVIDEVKQFRSYIRVTNQLLDGIKVILTEQRIFIFLLNSIYCYDIDSAELFNAENLIYIPTTKIIVDGTSYDAKYGDIEQGGTVYKGEYENELSVNAYTQYIFTNIDNFTAAHLEGKNLILEIDDEKFEITFKLNNEWTILGKYTSITDDNLSHDNVFDGVTYKDIVYGENNIPFVQVSEKGNMLLSQYIVTSVNPETKIPVVEWTIYHSVDGITFTKLPYTDGIISHPYISENGAYAIVLKDDGPYAYSLLDDDIYTKYSTWTSIRSEKSLMLNLNRCQTDKTYSKTFTELNQQIDIDAYFVDDENYAIVYGYDIQEDFSKLLHKSYKMYFRHSDYSDLRTIVDEPVTYSEDFSPVTNTITNFEIVNVNKPNVSVSIISGNMYVSVFSPYKISVNNKLYDNYYQAACKITNEFKLIIFGKISNVQTVNGTDRFVYSNTYLNKTPAFSIDGSLYKSGNYQNDTFIKKSIIDGKITILYAYSLMRFNSTTALRNGNQYIGVIQVDDAFSVSDGYTLRLNNSTRPFYKHYAKFSKPSGILITNLGLLFNNDYSANSVINLDLEWPYEIDDTYPVAFMYKGNYKDSVYLYRKNKNGLYTNDIFNKVSIKEKVRSSITSRFVPEHVSELQSFYFAKGKKLYISSYRQNDEGEFQWYFPKINTETFDYNISNIHPISDTDMAIFLPTGIYYVQTAETGYRYYKSKIQVGTNKGNDVITSYDGKYVIFSCERGLVFMSYQDFISSSEQALNYLSDTIYDDYKKFNVGTVRLYQYGYWIVVYRQDSNQCYVLDIRNSSWWKLECKDYLHKLFTFNDKPHLIINSKHCNIDTSDFNYEDYNGKIDWYFRSQKLHFDAINYNKHIINFTLASVNDNNNPCSINLKINNYRKKVNEGKEEIITYDIDVIRTFVKRVNYSKVSEFQYTISADLEDAIQVPLSLANLSIKYTVTGVIR